MAESIFPSTDLDKDIERYLRTGYRMDMIMPADAPLEVLLSRNGEKVRLRTQNRQTSDKTGRGRAGMEYRDLIPGRMDGRVIASHIRLTQDGEVPDYVHYHKVEFQMIYCLRGRIHVVYEDQGQPFWLEAGDCVLQPPEIRHRVLESTGGAEVVEVSMPAIHETWVEHTIDLPTSEIKPDRDFGGQRFCRFAAAEAEWQSDDGGIEYADTGIMNATGGLGNVRCVRTASGGPIETDWHGNAEGLFRFCFVTRGEIEFRRDSFDTHKIGKNESIFLAAGSGWSIKAAANSQFLEVSICE